MDRKFFFDYIRIQLFAGKLSQKQVNGLTAILDEWEKNYSQYSNKWLAYMLATVHHETDKSMQPIEEYKKGKQYAYGKTLKLKTDKLGQHIPYTNTKVLFYGRGFVQLTWYENYERIGQKLNLDLIHHPERVLELPTAIEILFKGMMNGWFTGVSLSKFLDAQKSDWVNARKIINGLDKAKAIADYAKAYYAAISHNN